MFGDDHVHMVDQTFLKIGETALTVEKHEKTPQKPRKTKQKKQQNINNNNKNQFPFRKNYIP